MSEKVSFFVDGVPVQAARGEKILWAALDAGIWIPHLCGIRERDEAFGACRLCLVEIAGQDLPVASCGEPVAEGLRVITSSPRLDRLRRRALELMLSHHDLDCRRCPKNLRCELQRLARRLKVPLRGRTLRRLETDVPIDTSHPAIVLNPNRCVLCGKCVWVCNEVEKAGAIDFVSRGIRTVVAPFNREPLINSPCTGCMRCVEICPTGAITAKEEARHGREAETG